MANKKQPPKKKSGRPDKFHALLKKACKPLAVEDDETSENPKNGDCNGKRIHQRKTASA